MASREERLRRALSGEEQEEDGPVTASSRDPVTLFLKSALSSTAEFFGADPLFKNIEKFRRDNPVAGTISELITPFGIYGAVAKVTRAVPAAARLITRIGSTARGPIGQAALREAARFAPLEASRVVGTAVLNPEDLPDAISQFAFNEAIAFGIGGVIGGFRSAGPSFRETLLLAGAELNAPRQVQLQQVLKTLRDGKVAQELRPQVERSAKQLAIQIRLERPAAGASRTKQNAVGDLMAGGNKKTMAGLLGLSGPQIGNLTQQKFTRRLVQGRGRNDFDKGTEVDAIKKRFFGEELASSFPEQHGQFFTHTTFKQVAKDADKAVVEASKKSIRSYLARVRSAHGNNGTIAENVWMSQEAEGGAYWLTMRIGKVGKNSATDEFLTFKAAEPGIFVPSARRSAQRVESKIFELETVLAPKLNRPDLDYVAAYEVLEGEIPLVETAGIEQVLGRGKIAGRKIRSEGLKLLGLDPSEKNILGERFADFINAHLAPIMFQFRNSTRARNMMARTAGIVERKDSIVEGIISGTRKLSKTESPMWQLFRGAFGEGIWRGKPAIRTMIEKLNDEDLTGIWQVFNKARKGALEEAFANGEITQRGFDFMKRLDEIDVWQVSQMNRTLELLEKEPIRTRLEHFMLTRTWQGTKRVRVVDEGGNTIHVAAADSGRAAKKEAEAVVEELKKQGFTGVEARSVQGSLGPREDLGLASELAMDREATQIAAGVRQARLVKTRAPGFFSETEGVSGFTGQKAPFTKKQLTDILTAHVSQTQNFIAESVVRAKLAPEIALLKAENPKVADQVIQRLDDFFGKPSAFAQKQNAILDSVLSPIIGERSATKIVRAANDLTMNFQLGMGNLMFVALNSVTFFQTGLPQLAFVMRASAEDLAKYYDIVPALDKAGAIRGGIGALSMFKVTAAGIKSLRSPTAALRRGFDRAVREQTLDPRLVEQFSGETASKILNIRQTFRQEGYLSGIKAVSEFGPGVSEKFARMHAFATMWDLAVNVMKLNPEKNFELIYRISKQFTNNTMFLYGTADRARLITGPMGTAFGLFKNWQMHYIGWMMEYAGQGLSRGNWSPLLWQLAGTTAVGGIASLPLIGVANQFSKFANDESLMTNLYDAFGMDGRDPSKVADVIYMGLPAFLGISMQASAQAPFASPVRDAAMMFSFVQADRARALGKAIGNSIDTWSITGNHPITDRNVGDQFVRALAPRSIYRTVQAFHGEGLRSLNTSNPQIKNLTMGEKVAFSLGFNPTFIEREFKVADELWKNQEERRKRIEILGRTYRDAIDNKDYREATRIYQKASAWGIGESVIKSSMTRGVKQRQGILDRFDPEQKRRFRNVLGRDRR